MKGTIQTLHIDIGIRFTDMDQSPQYNLTDLRFYIPKDKSICALYCLFKDIHKTYESIELMETPYDSNTYICYKLNLEQSFGLDSGDLTLTLFGICETNEIVVSEDFSINISTENYSEINKLYWADRLNVSVADYYKKIVELTNMNIEILSKMNNDSGGENFDK